MACDMSRAGVMFILDYKSGTATQDYSESHVNSHGRDSNDPGSNMLDNTVILWTAELSSGNHHRAESFLREQSIQSVHFASKRSLTDCFLKFEFGDFQKKIAELGSPARRGT